MTSKPKSNAWAGVGLRNEEIGGGREMLRPTALEQLTGKVRQRVLQRRLFLKARLEFERAEWQKREAWLVGELAKIEEQIAADKPTKADIVLGAAEAPNDNQPAVQ